MNDRASVGVLATLAVVIVLVGLIYIATGPAIDTLNGQFADQYSNPTFPISQDRQTCMANLNLIYGAFLILAVILPLGLYAIVTANADNDGDI